MFALQSPLELTNMLTPLLHRKRKAAEDLANVRSEVRDAIAQTQHIYGTRLLVRGLLWIAVLFLSRGLLELPIASPAARVLIALLPAPFFAWYLWTWVKGVAQMDELQRRIELEALGFAFPSALVILATLGLLDVALNFNAGDFSMRNTWLMMPMLYYIGLWLAKRRYQ
jgi:hypothetical protein